MRNLSLVLFSVALMGCNQSDDASTFRLAPQPRDRSFRSLSGVIADGTTMQLTGELALGLGEGYAPQLEVVLIPTLEDCLGMDGELQLTGVLASGGIDAQLGEEAHAVLVMPKKAGQGTVTLGGTYVVSQAYECGDVQVDDTFVVHAQIRVDTYDRPTVGFSVWDCGEDDRAIAQSDAQWRGISAHAVGPDGEPIELANADSRAQVPVTVIAGMGAEIEASRDTLETLKITGAPGPVTLKPDQGKSLDVRLLDAAEIDGVDQAFGVYGLQRDPWIDGGQTVDVAPLPGESKDVLASIFSVQSEGVTVCSWPRVEDFQLETTTPSICPITTSEHAPIKKGMRGSLLMQWARLQSSGDCSLSVRAPDYDGGSGWSRDLTATFLGVGQ